jgi:predicted acetyltransferase
MEHSSVRWMGRVLDVPAALEARGYAPVDGEATIEVDDPALPGNRGPWRVRAEGGRVSVAPGSGGTKPMSINAFSALYTGYATPTDLVLAGALDADDQRRPFLGALFAGTAPWMPDFF